MKYLLKLQKKLNLPIPPAQSMKYEAYSQVSDKDVDEAYENVQRLMLEYPARQLAKDLVAWPEFLGKLKKDYVGYGLKAEEKYHTQMEEAYDKLESYDFVVKSKELAREQEEETTKIYQEITLEILNGSPREIFTQKRYLDEEG